MSLAAILNEGAHYDGPPPIVATDADTGCTFFVLRSELFARTLVRSAAGESPADVMADVASLADHHHNPTGNRSEGHR